MAYSIQDIATALGAQAFGAVDLLIDAATEPAAAGPRDLALAMDPKYGDGLAQGDARAAILWDGADWQALGLEAAIFVPRPRYAMSGLTALMDPGPEIEVGVHPSAVVHPDAQIGEGAAVGPFVVIGRGTQIGANARIASHVSIAEGAQIGRDALICQGVRIGARVVIGDRFIAQPGAVIGSDGFSFVTPDESGIEKVRKSLGDQGDLNTQPYMRIHSLGNVSIGDDVEVGVHSAIDRGTIRDTVIGDGTKIDNLVQIGHNCTIGRDCLICSMSGLSGSVRVGNNVVLAGKTGVSDNVFIGDNVITGGDDDDTIAGGGGNDIIEGGERREESRFYKMNDNDAEE